MKFLCCWLICSSIYICKIQATISLCTENVVMYTPGYNTAYRGETYSCGFWGWSTCYRTVSYSASYAQAYYVTQCCAGYGGAKCLPICNDPSCGTNEECTKPNICTCIEGWTGGDCLTDIDECLEGTDICEEGCENTNGSYSCFCEDTEKLLANDGIHCLGGIYNEIAIPEVDKFTLVWLPPTNHSTDGKLKGYIMTCNNDTLLKSFVEFPFYNYTFTGLTPFTHFNCCIEAEWVTNGIGPPVCLELTTLEDAPSDSPQNITAIAGDTESVLVQWTPPTIPNGIILHYTLYINYNNGTEAALKVDSESTLSLIENLQVFQLVGVSLSASTNGGEGPMSTYVYGRSAQSEPGPVHKLEIKVDFDDSVKISWHPPMELNGIIINYHIQVKIVRENANESMIIEEWTLESDDTDHVVADLEPFVPYEVDVAAATSVGKGDIIRRVFFTDETIPSSPPNWIRTERLSATEMQLEWNELSLVKARGFITEYSVTFADSVDKCEIVDNENTTNVTYNQYSLLLDDLIPNYEYCVAIAASTTAGVGELSDWNHISVYDTKNIYYYISGVQDCNSITSLSQNSDQLGSFMLNMVSVIDTTCDCMFTSDYIYKANFVTCSINGQAVLEVSIVLPIEQYGDTMFKILDKWVDSSTLTIINDNMIVEGVCEEQKGCVPEILSTQTSVTQSTQIIQPTVNESAGFVTVVVSSVVSVILLVAVVFVVVIITVVAIYRYKRKTSNNNVKVEMEDTKGYEDMNWDMKSHNDDANIYEGVI